MNPMAMAATVAVVRAVLALGALWLVKHGVWAEGDASGYVAAASIFIVESLWTLWLKYKDIIILNVTLMIAKKSKLDIIEHIANGAVVPTVRTPKDTIPGIPAIQGEPIQ